jgi:hypothetical protein
MIWIQKFHFKDAAMYIKTRNELPTRSRNIPPPSDYLEAKSAKIDTEIAESSRKLLKAQLQAGQHKLTRESFVGIAKKYGWQFALLQHTWR